jgi:NTE family protein
MKKQLYLIFLFISTIGWSQTPNYENLVMEGGGIRGVAYGGALTELEAQGILPNIKRVSGTSAGAINAVLLSVGYGPQEVSDIIYSTEFRKFNDGRGVFIGGTKRLLNQYGWYLGEEFTEWMEKLIATKTENGAITFQELHEKIGTENSFRDLYVTGTDLTLQKSVVFSWETYPNMRIVDALRISMSVPLYYQAVFLDNDGNIVEKPKKTEGLHVMVDGGIISNFPIHIFDDPKYMTTISGEKQPERNPLTLGIRLDSDEQIEYDQKNEGLAPQTISGFKEYIQAFYNMVIESLNRTSLHSEDWDRTISISTVNIGPKVKHLADDQKNALVNSGKKGVSNFFEKQKEEEAKRKEEERISNLPPSKKSGRTFSFEDSKFTIGAQYCCADRLDQLHFIYGVRLRNLEEEGMATLNEFTEFVKDNPQLTLRIGLHTGVRGSDKYNKELSKRAAQSIVDYMVSKGVSRDQLIPVGYGEEKPILTQEEIMRITDKKEMENAHRNNSRMELVIVNINNNKSN